MSRLKQLQSLFDQACDLAPEQRAVFVDRECIDDDNLRAELLELLEVDRRFKSDVVSLVPKAGSNAPKGEH